jgi:hypothetical protein
LGKEAAAVKHEILELVNRDQFRNFAIVTTAGIRYNITDPNALAVARDKVHYYFPNSDRAIHVPYEQIATVEELPSAKKRQ